MGMVNIGIFGATGYTGYELIRILRRHPQAHIVFTTSERYAGQRLCDVFPCPWDLALVPSDEASLDQVDAAFLCLPHGASMGMVQRVYEAGVRAIDLSADFRLADATTYERWYGTAHTAPGLLPEAVYGLTEIHRQQIRGARLVANPGCYPTGALLGLYPLAREGLLAEGPIIVDAKSGVSGAGRKPSLTTHFVEVNENLSPYQIGHVHRHVVEMEQELNRIQGTRTQVDRGTGGNKYRVVFAPHLLPVNRGILTTMYVQLREPWDGEPLLDLYREVYAGEPFVQILPSGRLATLRHAVGTNRCAISLTCVDDTDHVIVVTAIDNLIKGASGQAVQNLNVMLGLEETLGLI
ncbi:MAG: N-acetyl-gamma-glutamyl-phosphate reductase [Anaerolineae bacterium]